MELSRTLIDSHALSSTLKVNKFFLRVYESLTSSCSRLARVDDSRWELTKTLMGVDSHQRSSSFGPGLNYAQYEMRNAILRNYLKNRNIRWSIHDIHVNTFENTFKDPDVANFFLHTGQRCRSVALLPRRVTGGAMTNQGNRNSGILIKRRREAIPVVLESSAVSSNIWAWGELLCL